MNRREAIKNSLLFSGYALSASTLTALLQRCKPEKTTGWTPAFLTPEQAALVADIAETILPKTEDSPGAKDVLVDRYIDLMLAEYVGEEDKTMFNKGLDDFAAACASANGGKAFSALPADQQLAYLNQLNQQALAPSDTPPQGPPPFFVILKQVVIQAYFSSEEVGTKVLAYDPIPGEWRGCVSLEEVSGGKAWALS